MVWEGVDWGAYGRTQGGDCGKYLHVQATYSSTRGWANQNTGRPDCRCIRIGGQGLPGFGPISTNSNNGGGKWTYTGPPIKRLAKAEITIRKEKEFCYNCGEKFVLGHWSKRQQFILIDMEDFVEEEVGTTLIEPKNEVIDEVQTISVMHSREWPGPKQSGRVH